MHCHGLFRLSRPDQVAHKVVERNGNTVPGRLSQDDLVAGLPLSGAIVEPIDDDGRCVEMRSARHEIKEPLPQIITEPGSFGLAHGNHFGSEGLVKPCD